MFNINGKIKYRGMIESFSFIYKTKEDIDPTIFYELIYRLINKPKNIKDIELSLIDSNLEGYCLTIPMNRNFMIKIIFSEKNNYEIIKDYLNQLYYSKMKQYFLKLKNEISLTNFSDFLTKVEKHHKKYPDIYIDIYKRIWSIVDKKIEIDDNDYLLPILSLIKALFDEKILNKLSYEEIIELLLNDQNTLLFLFYKEINDGKVELIPKDNERIEKILTLNRNPKI